MVQGIEAKPDSKYIVAYDPKIRRRTTFIIHEGRAISLISGHSFSYEGANDTL